MQLSVLLENRHLWRETLSTKFVSFGWFMYIIVKDIIIYIKFIYIYIYIYVCIRYKYIYIYLHIQHLKISSNSLSNEINHLEISSKKNLVASEKVFVNIVLITINQKKKNAFGIFSK